MCRVVHDLYLHITKLRSTAPPHAHSGLSIIRNVFTPRKSLNQDVCHQSEDVRSCCIVRGLGCIRLSTALQNISYLQVDYNLSNIFYQAFKVFCLNVSFSLRKVIEKVTQFYLAFIWNDNASNARGYRVKWEIICKPKSKEGIGLKQVKEWNTICLLKNFYLILTKVGSLLVAWLEQ